MGIRIQRTMIENRYYLRILIRIRILAGEYCASVSQMLDERLIKSGELQKDFMQPEILIPRLDEIQIL